MLHAEGPVHGEQTGVEIDVEVLGADLALVELFLRLGIELDLRQLLIGQLEDGAQPIEAALYLDAHAASGLVGNW